MRKFDTKVQYIKYEVLREVARYAWNETLYDHIVLKLINNINLFHIYIVKLRNILVLVLH